MGGLGGAILLVPALVLTGMSTGQAAPLGLISVAAGSIAAGAQQLRERSTNHRLGVATEVAGSTGAVIGASLSGIASDATLTYVLAGVAALAAVASFRRRAPRTDHDGPPVDVGERVGSLSGAYRSGDKTAPYTVHRLPIGLGLMTIAGVIAGTAGASGGFIKTPATSVVMGAPARVAASTTTFTVGITSAAALIVFALDGRIDVSISSAIITGSLVAGTNAAAHGRPLCLMQHGAHEAPTSEAHTSAMRRAGSAG